MGKRKLRHMVVFLGLLLSGTPAFGNGSFYLGGHGGYGFDDLDVERTKSSGAVDSLDLNLHGADYGGFVGYTRDYGNWRWALEFDYSGSSVDESFTSNERHCNPATGGCDIDLDEYWSVGGKLGYNVTENINAYIRVSYVDADFEWSVTEQGRTPISGDFDLDGVLFGGGVEVKTTDRLSLYGEIVYLELGEEDVFSDVDDTFEVDAGIAIARAGIIFRFYGM